MRMLIALIAGFCLAINVYASDQTPQFKVVSSFLEAYANLDHKVPESQKKFWRFIDDSELASIYGKKWKSMKATSKIDGYPRASYKIVKEYSNFLVVEENTDSTRELIFQVKKISDGTWKIVAGSLETIGEKLFVNPWLLSVEYPEIFDIYWETFDKFCAAETAFGTSNETKVDTGKATPVSLFIEGYSASADNPNDRNRLWSLRDNPTDRKRIWSLIDDYEFKSKYGSGWEKTKANLELNGYNHVASSKVAETMENFVWASVTFDRRNWPHFVLFQVKKQPDNTWKIVPLGGIYNAEWITPFSIDVGQFNSLGAIKKRLDSFCVARKNGGTEPDVLSTIGGEVGRASNPVPKPKAAANSLPAYIPDTQERSCRPTGSSIRCESNCVNGDCVISYENGCKLRVRVNAKFNSFNNQWEYPSPSC